MIYIIGINAYIYKTIILIINNFINKYKARLFDKVLFFEE